MVGWREFVSPESLFYGLQSIFLQVSIARAIQWRLTGSN